MGTDLWRFRSDVGHERAQLGGVDVDYEHIKVDRTKEEIQEPLTRHYGATSSRA